jgi:hypothetical protein
LFLIVLVLLAIFGPAIRPSYLPARNKMSSDRKALIKELTFLMSDRVKLASEIAARSESRFIEIRTERRATLRCQK